MRTLRLAVPKPATEVKIDRFIAKSSSLTPDRIRDLIARGAVTIRGKPVKPARKLWGGEEIEIVLPAPRALPRQQGPALPILHEDERFIVINKPAGLTVEPEKHQLSVVELLATQRTGFDVEGVAAPGVVHRLDRDTTGCLALAKSDDALAALKAAFESKGVDKRYVALVEGSPKDTEVLEGPYGRDPDDPRKYTTRTESPRRARLTYETRERFAEAALVAVHLDTGRTHQIRVQLSEAGHPVLGDRLYGKPSQLIERVALHAQSLAIEALAISADAPIPDDLQRALETLRTEAGITRTTRDPPPENGGSRSGARRS